MFSSVQFRPHTVKIDSVRFPKSIVCGFRNRLCAVSEIDCVRFPKSIVCGFRNRLCAVSEE
jgi:hypothetical protein